MEIEYYEHIFEMPYKDGRSFKIKCKNCGWWMELLNDEVTNLASLESAVKGFVHYSCAEVILKNLI